MKPRSCLNLTEEGRASSSRGFAHSTPVADTPQHFVEIARFIGLQMIISPYRDNSFNRGLVACCLTVERPHDTPYEHGTLSKIPATPHSPINSRRHCTKDSRRLLFVPRERFQRWVTSRRSPPTLRVLDSEAVVSLACDMVIPR